MCLYVHSVSLCVTMCMSAVPTKARRGPRIPLELGLQAVVSCPTWMLGTESGFFVRALHAITNDPTLWPEVKHFNEHFVT